VALHNYDHNMSSASTNQQCVDQCDDEHTQFVMTSEEPPRCDDTITI